MVASVDEANLPVAAVRTSGILDCIMAKSDTRIRICIVAYRGCSAWIAAGLLEFFAIAKAVARMQRAPVSFECHAVSEQGRVVPASHGVRLETVRPRGKYAALIVPPFWSETREEFDQNVARAARSRSFLIAAAQRASIVASACSGAVMLAEAGLLEGYRATTCWWLSDWFARRHPHLEIDARKLVVSDRNRWTAAAGTAYLHLCLELTRKLAGPKIASAAGRLALVEPRRGSQSPFMATSMAADLDDARPASRAIAFLQRNPQSPDSVATIAKRLGTTERTLNRQFRRAVGMTPIAYRQSQRIALAKRLLESDRTTLEEIVERCGYVDVASFRKLFAREVGMSPKEYRLRFAA
jgi:transcriptional regulator GlxA family with amidase domain